MVLVSIVGSLRDREVACSASDRQGSNFESCVWRTVSSQSSHHPQEVLLAQFSLYVHKGGLKPDSFHFIYFHGIGCIICLTMCFFEGVWCCIIPTIYDTDICCESSCKFSEQQLDWIKFQANFKCQITILENNYINFLSGCRRGIKSSNWLFLSLHCFTGSYLF